MENTNSVEEKVLLKESKEVQESTFVSMLNSENITDPLSQYIKIIKTNPGKSLYFTIIVLSLLFTLLPWFGTNNVNYSYFSLLNRNIFTLLYFLGLIDLIFIRAVIWAKIETFKYYYKVLDFFETAIAGAIILFTLTVNTFTVMQLGTIVSIFSNSVIFIYLIYLKLYKQNK